MKIVQNQKAPDFQAKDVYGNPVSLSGMQGRKVLLSFMRNVGCPVCNFRVHELLQKADNLQAKNITVVLIYESTVENMMLYLKDEKMPFLFIPDPENKLYKLYSIDKSGGKMMKGIFNGAIGKMKKGKRYFKSKIKQDGSTTTIEADFLIDEKGNVIKVNYGKFLGDQIPVTEILSTF